MDLSHSLDHDKIGVERETVLKVNSSPLRSSCRPCGNKYFASTGALSLQLCRYPSGVFLYRLLIFVFCAATYLLFTSCSSGIDYGILKYRDSPLLVNHLKRDIGFFVVTRGNSGNLEITEPNALDSRQLVVGEKCKVGSQIYISMPPDSMDVSFYLLDGEKESLLTQITISFDLGWWTYEGIDPSGVPIISVEQCDEFDIQILYGNLVIVNNSYDE